MALVIDGSSPAAHTADGNTPANVCASFVPPAAAMLLAMWAGDSSDGFDPTDPAAASSPSQTWTTDVWDHLSSGLPANDGQAAIFHTSFSSSPGSSTVTITNGVGAGGVQGSILKVYVLTGADPGTPMGVCGGGRQTSGSSITDSYTASITGGQGFMVISDWIALSTAGWTANAGCTIEDKGTVAGEISYGVVRRTDPDGVLGVTTSIGVSGLVTNGQYHWAYAEVISLEAALAAEQQAGYPSLGSSPPMF